MLLPHINEVGLESTCNGAKIKKTRDSTINFIGRDYKHLTKNHIIKCSFIEGVFGFLLFDFSFQLGFQLLENFDSYPLQCDQNWLPAVTSS